MKDLYTFDSSPELALETYEAVQQAYRNFFNELKLPYLVAEADSGNMGGNLSHEYHFASTNGEDNIISCSGCGYVANEELAQNRSSVDHSQIVLSAPQRRILSEPSDDLEIDLENLQNQSQRDENSIQAKLATWSGITKDKLTLVNVFFPYMSTASSIPENGAHIMNEVNLHAVKRIVPSLDAGVGDAVGVWRDNFKALSQEKFQPSSISQEPYSKIINLFDFRVSAGMPGSTFSNHTDISASKPNLSYFSKQIPTTNIVQSSDDGAYFDMVKVRTGDLCPRCDSGLLRVQKAIELGHTFHLGTRYSKLLEARVSMAPPNVSHTTSQEQDRKHPVTTSSGDAVELQMGCHGIGVSRMIGAIADVMADNRGLNWPRIIAPFEVAIISKFGSDEDSVSVYDAIAGQSRVESSFEAAGTAGEPIDVVLDDRPKDFIWKLNDADMIGCSILVILGKAWKESRSCEVQCRRRSIRTTVPMEDVATYVASLLRDL
jgi:prolyl-tRNA synthetase